MDSTIIHLIFIVLLAVLAYSNTLGAPFQFDEESLISENPIIKDLGYILNPSEAKELPEYGIFRRRYVGFVSFALNYRIHGLDVTGYHVFNILLHILNALLVYAFVLLIFSTPHLGASSLRKHSRFIALVSGLVFVLHPVQIEAVTYVYQRMASLVCFFYILTLVLYAKFRLASMDKGAEKRPLLVYYLPAVVCIILAVKTKEPALTLPFAVMLYEYFFFSGPKKARILLILPLFLPLILYPLALNESGLSMGTVLFGADSDVSEIVSRSTFDSEHLNPSETRWEYLVTQPRVAVTYLRLLFFPVNQNFIYDYYRSESLFEQEVLLSLLLLISILGLAVYSYFQSRTRNAGYRIIAFGIIWFFLTLSVESSIIPLPFVITEYRLYLPGVGIIMAVLTGVVMVTRKIVSGRSKAIVTAFLVLIPVVFGAYTYARNNVWRTNISLWEDVVRKSPRDGRARNNLGKAYNEAGMHEKASHHLQKAISLSPMSHKAHNNLGVAYRSMGMAEKAIEHLQFAIRLKPDFITAYINLGNAYHTEGLNDKAIEQYNIALDRSPNHAESHYNIGIAYAAVGQVSQAIEHYKSAIELDPKNFDAYNNLGVIYMSEGMVENAIEYFKIVLRLSPDYENAYFNLGEAFWTKGLADEAIKNYKAFLRCRPDYAEAHYNIGLAYEAKGLTDKAEDHYRRVLTLNPDYEEAQRLLEKVNKKDIP
jgi:tetratricopeptide (TPR) repeat protein